MIEVPGRGSEPAKAADDWVTVYSDGAARGNPGPAGAGARATDPSGQVVAEVSEYLGKATNNVAEYQALILGLQAVKDLGFGRIRVFTDSDLMANQVTGAYKVKNEGLKPLVAKARALLGAYREVEVQYIPREKNTACDKLANEAIDAGLEGLKEPIASAGDETLF